MFGIHNLDQIGLVILLVASLIFVSLCLQRGKIKGPEATHVVMVLHTYSFIAVIHLMIAWAASLGDIRLQVLVTDPATMAVVETAIDLMDLFVALGVMLTPVLALVCADKLKNNNPTDTFSQVAPWLMLLVYNISIVLMALGLLHHWGIL